MGARWTDEEIAMLREWSAAGESAASIGAKLGRQGSAVHTKRSQLGLVFSRAWSDAEIERMLELRGAGISPADIATVINRTESSVKRKAIEVLGPTRQWVRWTPELDDALRATAKDGPSAVVEATGRSVGSVRARAELLGIEIASDHRKWTTKEWAEMRSLWEAGASDAEIAERMDRTIGAVIQARGRAGLHKRTHQEVADLVQLRKKPKTRGECIDGPRPCRWECRYRLEHGPDSCSLDVADRVELGDSCSLEDVSVSIGLTRERVRQIESKALAKLRAAMLEFFGEDLEDDEIRGLLGGMRQLGTASEGREIAEARERMGLSRPELAEMVGIPEASLMHGGGGVMEDSNEAADAIGPVKVTAARAQASESVRVN